jgi:hypothetical protein
MPYQVKKYDGTELVTISDYQYNDTSSTVVLFGKGVTNYGQPMAENLIHLLENFAGPTAPGLPSRLGEPLVGQLWYDTMNRKLRVRSPTSNWDVVGSANVGATPPTPPNQGDLWLDTSTDPAKLKVYNGEKWQLVGSSAAVGSVPTAGTYSTGEVGDLNGENYFTTTSLGTNAEPQVGDMWWDYGTKQFKIFEGTKWDWVGPMMDKDRDTFISPESLKMDGNIIDITSGNPTMPGVDDDILHFVCKGLEQVKITVGSLRLPSGPTNERPGSSSNTLVPAELGMVRYNSEQNRFEGTIANGPNIVWTGLGGVIDVDQDTYISAERKRFLEDGSEASYTDNADPGFDSDTLDFFTRGFHAAKMIPSGDMYFLSKGFIQLPVGASIDRPTFDVDTRQDDPTIINHNNYGSAIVQDGMMRYNSQKNQFEVRIAGSWVGFKNPRPFSGLEDVDFYSSIRFFFNHLDLVTTVTANPTAGQVLLSQQMLDVGVVANQKLIHVVHNLEEPYVFVQIYDDKRQMIIPDEIYLVDKNNIFIDVSSFLQNIAGTWQLSSTGKGPTNIPNYTSSDTNATTGKWCAIVTR